MIRSLVRNAMLLMVSSFLMSTVASATMITLSLDQNCAACPPAAGTVTLTDTSLNHVTVAIQLIPGFSLRDGNSNHNALTFFLDGISAIQQVGSFVSGDTTSHTFEWVNTFDSGTSSYLAGNISDPPFGGGNFAVDCTGCTSGSDAAHPTRSLSFEITAIGLSTANFISKDGSSVILAVDVIHFPSSTYNVGATILDKGDTTGGTPEPQSAALMAVGLVGIALIARKTRRQSAN